MGVAAGDRLSVDDVVDDDCDSVRAAVVCCDTDDPVGDCLDVGAGAGDEVGALMQSAVTHAEPVGHRNATAYGHWTAQSGLLVKTAVE